MSEYELPDPGLGSASAHYNNEEALAWVSGTEHMREIAMEVIERVEAERDYLRDELNGIHNRLRDLAGVEWQGQPTTDDLMGKVEKIVYTFRRARIWQKGDAEPRAEVVLEDGVGDRLANHRGKWFWSRVDGRNQNPDDCYLWEWREVWTTVDGDTLTEVIGV